MNRKGKRYTEEELKKIKELYAKGHSASLILKEIDRPVDHSSNAGTWLFQMQKRLNLPKRGVGFRGIRNKFVNKERLKRKLELVRKRKAKIPKIIKRIDTYKIKLQKELSELLSIINDLENELGLLGAKNCEREKQLGDRN